MINKTYKKIASILLVSILVLNFLPVFNPAFATINETFNFQAKLTNVNGTNVSDGTYNFRFSIYDASSAGNCLWTAKGTIPGSGACTFAAGTPGTDLVALTVTNGLLNTQLGTTAGSLRSFEDGAASLAQFSNNSLYLDIQIYNGSSWETFGSRKLLEAVPYAFRSKYSDNAGTSTNVPISGLTLAGANNSINNGNYNQTWNWALTSASQTGLLLSENTASVSSGTPSILGVNTLASSTAIPIYVQNIGSALSFRVDDQGSDTSPFVVDASGKVGIGTDAPSAFLHIKSGGGVNSGINLEATSAASYGVIDFNTASGLAGQFLATGASFSNGIFTGDQIALASYINTGSTTLVAGGTSGYINFATGGYSASNERMRIIANGNVGIGDTTPASLFTVGNTDLFQIDSSGNIVKLNNVTTSFPGSQGAANSVLVNNGSGTLTWGTALTGVTIPISKLAAASATNTIDNTLYAQTWNWNSLTTETALSLGSSSISSGTLLNLSSTSTAAAGNTQKVLNISTSGANGTSTQTTYGTYVSNTHTGTSSTNIGGYFTASGGATNYPIYIGDSSPPAGSSAGLKIGNMTAASGSAFEAISIGTQSGTGTAGTGISVGTISNSGSSKNYGINLQGITGASTMANYGISIGSVTSSDGVGYGLYIGSVSGSTTNYGIYSSSGNIFFSGNTGIGDNTPASALTVGNGDLFQVNSSGQIAAAAGVTSSGTITFSGLSAMGAIVSTTGGALTSVTSTTGNFLRHNGTTWVASTIQSTDIPTGSGSYIQNQISAVQSSSNFWISDIAGIANGDLNSGGKIRFRKADNSGWDGSIYQTNGNIFTLLAGIGGRIDILDSPGVPNTVYLYNRYDDNALRTSLTLTRSRSSTTAPNANFGSSIDSNLEGFTNNTDLLASRISTFWENNQTNDTTDRDSAISFSTLLDNTFNEKIRISSAGNLGIGDTSPASALTVGSGDLFQVNSSGQIAAAAGITSSGTITFSGLSAMGAIVSTTGGALTSVTSTTGNFLRHNGTTWVASTIASGDIPTGSANYIQNQSGSAQTGNSWISGMTGIANGDLGGGGTIRFRKADNSGWDGAIYEANSNMLYLQSGIGNRITLRDSSSLDLAIFDKTAGSNFYNTTDDNNVYPTLISNRNRSSATAPGAGFGSDVQFILEGFSNTSTPIASAIRTTWENNQTNDTTDRDSTLAFRTMLDNSLSTKLTILSSGNVGIGDTSPVGLLTVGNGDLFQVSTLGNVTLNSINTTQTTTSSIVSLNGNSLTSGTGLYAASSTLSSGKLIDIQVSGTAAASNTQTALNILTAGANGTTTQTTYGAVISNTHTGTLSSNVGASFSASGGTASNTAIFASATGTSNNAAIFNSGDVAIRNGITNITNNKDSLNVNKELGADVTAAWTTGTSGGTARSDHKSILYNGKVYSWGDVNSMDIYDISTATWTTGTSGGTARTGFIAEVYNGKIYYWGSTSFLTSVDIYDIANNSWSTGTSGGTGRYGASSVLYNGKIYIWGGSGGGIRNIIDIYDIANNSWSTGTAGGTARYYHTSILYNGKMYSWGGWNGSSFYISIDIYDIANDSWSTGASGGTGRYTLSSEVYNSKIYFFGGWNGSSYVNTVDIYNILTNSWSTGTAFGGTAYGSDSTVIYNGKIYRMGGSYGPKLDTVNIYDIGNRQNILSIQENGQDTFSFQSNSQLFLSSGRLGIMGGNVGIGDSTPAGLFTVGNGDLFQVSSLGNVTLNSVNTTQTTTSSIMSLNGNSLTSGTGLYTASSTLSSGKLIDIQVSGTAAASNTQTALNILTAGANGTTTQTTYGAVISNTHTGTLSSNVGASFSASGGTASNTAILASATGTSNNAAIFNSGDVAIRNGITNITNSNDSLNVNKQLGADITGAWTTGATGGTGRDGPTSVLYNGKIYSWGGTNGSNLNTVDIYDIASNSWSTGTAGGTARFYHTSVLYNGKIYSWGGTNGGNLSSVDIYDIAGNSWSTGTAGGTARYGHTSVLYNGKIYSWGGYNGSYLNTVDIYDIAGNSWSTGTAGGTARYIHTSVLYNGKIYSWGGNNGSNLNTVDIYDIASNSWSTGTAGGTARNTHTSVLYYGKIYSWGGTNSIILLNTVDIYDIAGNSWSTGTAGGTARRSPISVLYNGKIYYWGGYTGSYPNTVDIYDIGNRQSILSVQENGQDTFSFQSNSQLFLSSGRLSIMGGNFQIGTTTDSGYKFDVSGSTRFAGNIVNTSGVNATGDQESLVPNTGFEVNDDKTTTVADGWTKFTVSGSGGTASVSTTKIQGEYSQAVVLAANTDGVGFYSPCIPITGGNTYGLYAFTRDLTTGSNTNALTLRLATYTSAANCSSRTSPTNYDSVTNGTVTNAFAQSGNTVSPAATQFWGRVEVQFDTPTSADTFYADSVRLTVSSLAAGVDLAENFPIEDGYMVDAGDIVSVSSTNSDSGIKYIKKSSGEFDNNIIGIVSTKPGITLDDGNTYAKAKVALAGRVPVKISTLSEAIKAGDYITSSSEEGKAMKASRTGQVIGKALNDWDPLNPTDKIVVLIDNSYYYHRDVEFAAFTDRLNALQNTVNGQNQTLNTTTQLLNTTINSTTTTGPTLSGGFESLDLSKLSGLLSKFSIESDGSLMFNSKAKFSDSLSVDNFVTKKISSENSDILIELNETISKNKLLIANKAGVELFSIDYKGNARFSKDVTINGDLYVDGKVAGKSVFESKWVEISPSSEESIKHNLGEIPRSINILRASESDCESKNGELECTNVTNEGFGNKEMYYYKNLDKSSLKVVNALSDKIFVKVFVTK